MAAAVLAAAAEAEAAAAAAVAASGGAASVASCWLIIMARLGLGSAACASATLPVDRFRPAPWLILPRRR